MKKDYCKKLILILLIDVLIEIFVFNIRTLDTVGYPEKELDSSYLIELSGGGFDENGDIVINSGMDYVLLNIEGFDYPLYSIYLDIECLDDEVTPYAADHVCNVRCIAFDDAWMELVDDNGNSRIENYSLFSVTQDVIHNIKNSHYIYMEPYGKTHGLQLILHPESGHSTKLHIHNLSFNKKRPFIFSFVRLFIVYTLLLFVYFTLFDPLLRTKKCSDHGWLTLLLAILVFFFNALLTAFLIFSNKALFEISSSTCSNPSMAMTYGQVDEHYVNYGLLPYIVFYLPYYLLTGKSLPALIPQIILILMTVILTGRFLFSIIKKYYRNTSLSLYLLMWLAITGGMYIPALTNGFTLLYDIPVFSGLVLTLAGLCLWLDVENSDGKIYTLKLSLGSLCMAAVILCRPFMLFYSLLILACDMWNGHKIIKKSNRKELTRNICIIVIPYAVFGVIYMIYNDVCWGSPFDFKGAYITSMYSTNKNVLFVPYVVFRAMYEYLFKPAAINRGFPFTEHSSLEKLHSAGNILTVSLLNGGIISSNPFTWTLVAISLYRKYLKEKKLLLPMLACFSIAFILMIYSVVSTNTICTSFTLEFSPVILFSACIMIMELYNDIKKLTDVHLKKILLKILELLLIISILWGLAQFVCDSTGSTTMRNGNTELWYKIYYSLKIF